MSNRERWIVYPLLFFALGMGLRDNMVPPVESEVMALKCRHLTVTGEDGASLVEIGGTVDDSGYVLLYRPADSDVKRPDSLEAPENGPSGDGLQRPIIRLGSSPTGGYLKLLGPPEIPTLSLEHNDARRVSGLFGEKLDGDWMTLAEGGDEKYLGTLFPWDALRQDADATDAPDPAADGQLEAGGVETESSEST